MLVDIGVNSRIVYEEDFETFFLEATKEFYYVESQQCISSNSCPDYMKKIENRRREELDRVQHYLDQSSENKVREVVEAELIAKHMHTLVHVCCFFFWKFLNFEEFILFLFFLDGKFRIGTHVT